MHTFNEIYPFFVHGHYFVKSGYIVDFCRLFVAHNIFVVITCIGVLWFFFSHQGAFYLKLLVLTLYKQEC